MSTQPVDARQGCVTVFVKAIKNIIFYGGTTLLIKFIGGYSWGFGVALSVALALSVVVNIGLYITSTISMLTYRPQGAFERLQAKYAPPSENAYLVIASIGRFIKEAICVLYLVYLYRFFF
jgi:hypothetical protein